MNLNALPNALARTLALVHPAARITYHGSHRTHVELRRLPHDTVAGFDTALGAALERIEGIEAWRRIGELDRVVIAHEPGALDDVDIIELIEGVEQALGLGDMPYASRRFEHLGADAGLGESAMMLGANALALGLSAVSSRSGTRPDIGVAATLASAVPTVRDSIERRFGGAAAQLSIDALSSFSRLINRSGVAAVTGLLVESMHLAQADAAGRAWNTWEPRLFSDLDSLADDGDDVGDAPARQVVSSRTALDTERVVPMPWGPVESYVDRATLLALGSFLFRLAARKPLQDAATFLYAGLPLPARIGRDALISSLCQRIYDDGGLVTRRDRLAHLDRVDHVIVDADLYPPAEQDLEDFELFVDANNLSADEVRTFAICTLLGLPTEDDGGLSLRRVSADDRGNGYDVLRDGRRIGVLRTHAIESAAVDRLRQVADDAGVGLNVVGAPASLQGVGEDIALRVDDDLVLESTIRRLQRDGKVVMYIGTHGARVFGAADLGVWCWRTDATPAWNADAIMEARPASVELWIHAAGAARDTARRSVRIAQAEAAVGLSIGMTFPSKSGFGRVFGARHFAAIGAFIDGVVAGRSLPHSDPGDGTRRQAWHAMTAEDVLRRLDSSHDGLSSARLAELAAQSASEGADEPVARWGGMFFEELRNPMTPILLGGAGLSAATASNADAAMVVAVLGLDAAWAASQRLRATALVDRLARVDRADVQVLREGELRTIEPEALVPGDVVHLAAGNVVPADLRILEATALEADESALTGESAPVRKQARPSYASAINEQRSLLFEGTSLSRGSARAVVIAAGRQTEAGRIAREGRLGPRRQGGSHSQTRLAELSRLTLPAAGAASALMFGSGLLRGTKPQRLLRSVVSMSVAAIPEGLTLLPTVAGLAAAARLSDRGVRIRDHLAIERAADVDVLCIDKTGTITESSLDVAELVSAASFDDRAQPLHVDALVERTEPTALHGAQLESVDDLLHAALAASVLDGVDSSDVPVRDRVDDAVLRAGRRLAERFAGHEPSAPDAALAFDARRRYQAARFGDRLFVKGAPEAIFELCELDDDTRRRWTARADELSAQGRHVLAVADGVVADAAPGLDARRLQRGQLRMRGLLALRTRVRANASETLAALDRAGVRTVMLTGDHPATARAIADEVGLGGEQILDGATIDRADPDTLARLVREGAHFARVTPIHKAKIVRALQRSGHHVAMLGDGTNDTGALRRADVGVVIDAQATPAAIDAADAVVDGNLATVLELFEEGRRTKSAIADAAGVLVGGNLGEIGFVGLAGAITGASPLNARQLLLVNLLTDAAPALVIAARDGRDADDVDADMDAVDGEHALDIEDEIAWRGLITASTALAAWSLARVVGSKRRADSVALLALVGAQLAQTARAAEGDRRVLITSAASMAALVGIVQTPGLSRLAGSRPVGPIGLGIAGAATASAVAATHLVDKLPAETRKAPGRWLTSGERAWRELGERADGTLEKVRGTVTGWLERAATEVRDRVTQIVDPRMDRPSTPQRGTTRSTDKAHTERPYVSVVRDDDVVEGAVA